MTTAQRYGDKLRVLGLLLMGVLAVSIAFIMLWDEPLAWYFETQLDHSIHTLFGVITEFSNSVIWFGLAAIGFATCTYVARKAVDLEQGARYLRYAGAWFFMLVSMATAAALLNMFKFALGRYRPRYLFDEDLSGFEPFGIALKMASFPSGHARSIWSAMIALCCLTPRFTPLYIAIALTVRAFPIYSDA